MRIAICDKDNAFAYILKRILYAYSNRNNLDIFVETFKSGRELLKSNKKYFLIFMEYSPKCPLLLKTVKEIQKKNINAKIIFTAKNTDFILDAFEFNPYRFLLKPIKEEYLCNCLDELFYNSLIHYPIFINDGFTTHCIDTAQITYLEADNKNCYVHLYDNVILCKKTMARVYDTLPKIHFSKINRSFVVNLNCINKYNSENVSLKNGEDLHITRTYYKDFKECYLNYSSPLVI